MKEIGYESQVFTDLSYQIRRKMLCAFSLKIDNFELVLKTHLHIHQDPCMNMPSQCMLTSGLDPVIVQNAISDVRLLFSLF